MAEVAQCGNTSLYLSPSKCTAGNEAWRDWGEGTREYRQERSSMCVYLERATPFNDPYSLPFLQSLPETLIEVPASIIPLFGRTQYRRGAVVFTLKHTFLSVGLESLRFVVTTSENGPVKKENRVNT